MFKRAYSIIIAYEKCPNTDFFLVRIQSKCGKMMTRKNSAFGHFSGNEKLIIMDMLKVYEYHKSKINKVFKKLPNITT